MIKQEWAYLRKNKILLLVFLAIIAIPTIYTTLFLGSMWDPYNKIDQLPVAIVNEDKAVTYSDERLDVGKEMVDSLKENDSLDFHFVSKSNAKQGLKDGTYYMVITIPEDFSANASTILDEHPKKMELSYETNPGTNYIASKLSESALTKIRTGIAETVTKTYTETVFDQIITAGDGIKKATDGSKQLENGSSQLADGNNTITANLNVLADSSLAFRSGVNTMQVGLKQYTDSVVKLSRGTAQLKDGLYALNDNSYALAGGINQLANGSSDLKAGLSQYTTGVSTVKKGSDTLNSNSSTLATGAAQLQTGVNKLAKNSDSLNQGIENVSDGLGAVIDSIPSAASKPKTKTYAQSVDTSAASENASATANSLSAASSNNKALQDAIESSSLSADEKYSLICLANTTQSSIENATANASLAQESISQIPDSLATSATAPQSADISDDTLSQLKTNLINIKNQIDADNGLTQGIKDYTQGVAQVQAVLNGDGTPKNPGLAAGIQNYTEGVSALDSGLTELNNNTSYLTSGAEQLNGGLMSLNSKTPSFTSGVNQLYSGSRELDKGTQALTSNNSTLVDGGEQLLNGASRISTGADALADGSAALGHGITQIKNGAGTLAAGLSDGADKINSLDADEETFDMFSSPVKAKESIMTDVKNNGHGMAPYMMSVALWVAGIAFSIMYPLTKYHDKLQSGLSWWASKASIVLLLSIVDALLMIGCLHLFNGFAPAEMGKTMLVAVLASLSFMSIMYFFNVALGKVGSFLMLIYMVVQLSGAAGTYPVELSGDFVSDIHAYLPFTYTVDAFRCTISGETGILPCIIMLVIIAALFSSLTVLMFKRRAYKIKHGKPLLSDYLEKLGLA